ncbi:MAG: hypothetical protein ABIN96_08795 [Rubrivivax sp.]
MTESLRRLLVSFSLPPCLLVAMLAGCGTTSSGRAGGAPANSSQTGDAQLDKLNQGYSLLQQNAAGLKLADKILLIKFESDRTHQVVTAISDYAGRLEKQLDELPARYPSIRVDLQPLPEIEKRKQAAANRERVLSLAPVVGRTGPDFERTLLLTLSGALNQMRFLTQLMAEQERNTGRAALLNGSHDQLQQLYQQTLKLLSEQYYKVNDYNPADFKKR